MMRKRKRGPGLFELLEGNGDGGVGVPEFQEAPGRRGSSASHPATAGPESARTSPPPCMVPDRSAPRRDEGEPLFELAGDRIRVSLTSFSAAVALFGILVGVFGVLEAGRWLGDKGGFRRGYAAGRDSYAADAMSEIEAARSQAPTAELLEGLWREPMATAPGRQLAASGAADGASQTEWIRGYTYIVVQEFGAGREADARRAQAFLAQHGVGTEIVTYPSGAIQLVTTQGYNRNDPTQRQLADQLQGRIHALGSQYFAAGGGYKLEGYFKSLKGDTW